MRRPLEDERNALLERMHASRTTYRSELSHVEEQSGCRCCRRVSPQ